MPGKQRPEGRVRLKDVLRLDVSTVHGANTSEGLEATAPARFVLRLLNEDRPKYRIKIIYCPPLPLLWNFGRGDGSPASVLHRAWARAVWRERGLLGRTGLLLSYLAWPFIVGGLSIWITAVNGETVRVKTGKSALRQIRDQWGLAVRHAILPPWYYIYELFEESNRARAGEYLRREETKGGLYRLLKESGAKRKLFDKRRFTEECVKCGVATPESIVFEKGDVRGVGGRPVELARSDLFAKPSRGQGGRGAELWRYDGQYWSRDGQAPLAEAELIEHFKEISRREAYLVQRRLTNHPDIAELSFDVLSTVRALTCRDESGGFELTHAVYRMPKTPHARVDNLHAGGIAAKIDFASGELCPASDLGLRPDTDWWSHHPHSGAKIEGRILPYWQETMDLARRAHAAFPKWVAVGWDIAITQAGPVVIEGNSGPDVDLIQRPYRAPLGSSRFGELMAHHLEARGLT